MGGSILDGCGKYSEDLTEISNLIKKTKLKNGEPFDIKTSYEVEQDIYYAYQKILNKLIDKPELVGIAINNLREKIEQSPNISSIFGISENSVQVALEHEPSSNNISENIYTSQDEFITAVTEEIGENVVIGETVYTAEEVSSAIEEIKNATELYNIKDFEIANSDDEKMQFKNETEELVEREICMIQSLSKEVYAKAGYYPQDKMEELQSKLSEIRTKSSHDLWIDSELRNFNNRLLTSEPLNSLEFKGLENLLDNLNPEKISKTKFVDDQFTSWEKIGLAKGLLEVYEKNPSEETKKLCEKMKESDPEIYELVSGNIDKIKALEGKSSDEFVFAEGVSDRKSFIENMKKQLELKVEKPKGIQEKEGNSVEEPEF